MQLIGVLTVHKKAVHLGAKVHLTLQGASVASHTNEDCSEAAA